MSPPREFTGTQQTSLSPQENQHRVCLYVLTVSMLLSFDLLLVYENLTIIYNLQRIVTGLSGSRL